FDVGSPTLGSATWTRVETELEAYADAWAAEHRDACEATEVRHEQSPALMDRRMQCLDGGLRSLGALLRTFEAADTTAVHKADAAVDALPRLDRCHDAERLEAAFAPPDDPEVVRAVEALQVVMAEARAEAHTGHYDRARAVVERIVGEVEALGYAPLSAEHALAVGEFVSLDGDYVEGEKLLREALVRSRRLRVQRWVSEAELLLTYVLFKRERYDDALNLADLALADAEHDADPFRLARVLERRGLILTKLGRHSAAVGDLLRAVGDLKAAGADSLTLARVRASLGSSYYWSGDPARAGVEHQQALTILRERMGRHPDVAASLSNLAMFQHDGGEMAAALASTEEALSIARETLGPRHPKTATYLENKSSILGSMGEDDAALEALEEVLELRIERLGPRSSAVAQVYNNIGVTHYTSGRMQQALDNFQRSLEIREEVLGERSPDTLLSLSNVAALLAEMGRLDESAPLTERAASATVAALGDDHPDSIAARTNVVRLRLDQKRVADARAVADVVLASAQRALPEVHPLWSTVWRTLAFVSSKEGQLDEAVTAHEKELAAATAVGMAYEIDNARKSLAEAREAAAE
ncbi:MAG: tetratricopeptide repeat protein, partial [Myxococcota bacterium]